MKNNSITYVSLNLERDNIKLKNVGRFESKSKTTKGKLTAVMRLFDHLTNIKDQSRNVDVLENYMHLFCDRIRNDENTSNILTVYHRGATDCRNYTFRAGYKTNPKIFGVLFDEE